MLAAGDENLGAVAIEGPPGSGWCSPPTSTDSSRCSPWPRVPSSTVTRQAATSVRGQRSSTRTSCSPRPTGSSTTSPSVGRRADRRRPPSRHRPPLDHGQSRPADHFGHGEPPAGASQVQVLVQEDGSSGTWWSAANSTWKAGPFNNPATLASPGRPRPPGPCRCRFRLGARSSRCGPPRSTVTGSPTSIRGQHATPSHETFTVRASTPAPTLRRRSRGGPGTGVDGHRRGLPSRGTRGPDLARPRWHQLADVVATPQGTSRPPR